MNITSFKLVLSILLLNLNLISTQSYYNNNNDYDFRDQSQQQTLKQDDIEQKYVNNGQSVLLVCDLPNQMPDGKVLFIKYDKILTSGSDIIVDSDDERFEIGQQYAWEWSLKINSINEDDAGVYFCKVGNVLIKQYEIIVRVPPRIKDDLTSTSSKVVREGENLQLSCFATGVPKPNITWYSIQDDLKSVAIHTGNYLNLENLTRFSPKKYQCKASNNIPPSDTRNFSIFVEFAPEIEVKSSKLDRLENQIILNCTIKAAPLTNRYFWRRDGNYLKDTIKTEIRNIRVNEFTLIAQLIIKQFNEMDYGLYECSAENDLRVSKVVYTLKDTENSVSTNMMPIGYANNYREEVKQMTSTNSKNRKANKHQNSASLKEILQKRPHQQRNNNRNQTKLQQVTTTATNLETTNNYNSPYIIILDDEATNDETTTQKNRINNNKLNDFTKNYHHQQTENKSNSINLLFNFNLVILMFVLNLFILN